MAPSEQYYISPSSFGVSILSGYSCSRTLVRCKLSVSFELSLVLSKKKYKTPSEEA
ncbi:unnamed protein product [Moneuplotes crassus]|uniref:Uncharacterized protein n=1 Tax=Euplotes crassus TaxID=5936 RepID=A0AAD1XMW9_EUPCR|nr:unnamed protein product [Moneuplotes crassus]